MTKTSASSQRHSATAALLSGVAVAFAACSSPPARDDAGIADERCDAASFDLRWDDEGLPPPGSPIEWVEKSIPFRRPTGTSVTVQSWLPWDMNDRQAYYLRAGEDVHVRLRIMVGDGYPDATAVVFRVFVNAALVPVIVDGSETSAPRVPVSDGLADVVMQLPAARFELGMSNVHFVGILESGDRARWQSGWSMTVANQGVDASVAWTDTDGLSSEVAESGFHSRAFWTDADGAERPMVRWRELPAPGPFDVTLRLQQDPQIHRCDPEVTDTFAIVALLDGEPFELGDHERLVATLAARDQRVHQFALEIPDDGMAHRLEIYQLPGLGRPARLAGRRRMPPWPVWVRRVSELDW